MEGLTRHDNSRANPFAGPFVEGLTLTRHDNSSANPFAGPFEVAFEEAPWAEVVVDYGLTEDLTALHVNQRRSGSVVGSIGVGLRCDHCFVVVLSNHWEQKV